MFDVIKNLLKGKDPSQIDPNDTSAVSNENELILSQMQILADKLKDSSQQEEADGIANEKWLNELRKEGRGF